MGRVSIDQTGQAWDITWGTSDPSHTLKANYGITGRTGLPVDYAVFQDPHYPTQTQTLAVYALNIPSDPRLFVETEITPGVYAVGVRK